MHRHKRSLYVLLLALVAAISAWQPAAAADGSCTYDERLTAGAYLFTVTAASADSCASQQLQLAAFRDNVLLARATVVHGAIVEKAWLEDLDEDGRQELLLLGHDSAEPAKKTLELFVVDGAVLKQVRFPDPPDLSGYRGGDRFSQEAGRVVRTFPLYRPQDPADSPSGGERTVVYQYRNRELLLVSVNDSVPPSPAGKAGRKTADKKDTGKAKPKITAIEVRADYIEIVADGPIERYKSFRLDDPWRLVVDITGVGSAMTEKRVAINSQGISEARIGSHRGYLRIVFVASVSPLPVETITTAENALRLSFYRP